MDYLLHGEKNGNVIGIMSSIVVKNAKEKRIALIWLRNDLRVSDHIGFYKASQECDQIFAYYTFDERHLKKLVGVLKNLKNLGLNFY